VRELVGARVELGVRERPILEGDGDGERGARGLRGDDLVNQPVGRVREIRLVLAA